MMLLAWPVSSSSSTYREERALGAFITQLRPSSPAAAAACLQNYMKQPRPAPAQHPPIQYVDVQQKEGRSSFRACILVIISKLYYNASCQSQSTVDSDQLELIHSKVPYVCYLIEQLQTMPMYNTYHIHRLLAALIYSNCHHIHVQVMSFIKIVRGLYIESGHLKLICQFLGSEKFTANRSRQTQRFHAKERS